MFYLNAILWFVYAIYIYFDMAVINHNELSADIVAVFVLVNTAATFASGLALGKQQKPAFYFALIVLVLNIILALANVTDIFFLVAFIIDAIILWALLPLRKDYLS